MSPDLECIWTTGGMDLFAAVFWITYMRKYWDLKKSACFVCFILAAALSGFRVFGEITWGRYAGLVEISRILDMGIVFWMCRKFSRQRGYSFLRWFFFYIFYLVLSRSLSYLAIHILRYYIPGLHSKKEITGIGIECWIGAVCTVISTTELALILHLLNQNKDLREKNEKLEMRERLFKKYEQMNCQQSKKIRQMRHDIGNYVSVVEQLVNSGEIQRAKKAAEELNKRYQEIAEAYICEDPVVSALIQEKEEICQQQEIEMKIDLRSFTAGRVTDLEWISIFSNLIDNAIEECMALVCRRKRVVSVESTRKMGYQTITVKNFCADQEKREKISLKKEFEIHGTGSGILKELAQKYEGFYVHRKENGVFTATFVIQTDKQASDEHAGQKHTSMIS